MVQVNRPHLFAFVNQFDDCIRRFSAQFRKQPLMHVDEQINDGKKIKENNYHYHGGDGG